MPELSSNPALFMMQPNFSTKELLGNNFWEYIWEALPSVETA